MSFNDEEDYNSKYRPSITRNPNLADQINSFNRSIDTMTPEQYKFMRDWTAEGEREAAEVANEDLIQADKDKKWAAFDAEGAEQAKWEENNMREVAAKMAEAAEAKRLKEAQYAEYKAIAEAKYAEEARIKEAANRRAADLEYLRLETDGYVDANGFKKDFVESTVNDTVAKHLKTPVFKVGGGVKYPGTNTMDIGGRKHHIVTKSAEDLDAAENRFIEGQNIYLDPDEVINGGDVRPSNLDLTVDENTNVDFTTAKQRQDAADRAALTGIQTFRPKLNNEGNSKVEGANKIKLNAGGENPGISLDFPIDINRFLERYLN